MSENNKEKLVLKSVWDLGLWKDTPKWKLMVWNIQYWFIVRWFDITRPFRKKDE